MKEKSRKPKLESINESLYQQVANLENISQSVVKDIINNGQSKFTAHIMSNNTFHGVRWPYFGVFKAKHKVVQVLNYMKGLDPVQKEFFKLQLRLNYKNKLKLNSEDMQQINDNLQDLNLNSEEDGTV